MRICDELQVRSKMYLRFEDLTVAPDLHESYAGTAPRKVNKSPEAINIYTISNLSMKEHACHESPLCC